MSGGKFASLTAGLLVRKAEPRPSDAMSWSAAVSFAFAPEAGGERAPTQPKHEAPQLAVVPRGSRAEQCEMHEVGETREWESVKLAPAQGAGTPPESTVKPRRLMVTLSPSEHETLGLIGVKKGVSRHQLLRNALDEYLALLVEEYSEACSCINTGCSCASPA